MFKRIKAWLSGLKTRILAFFFGPSTTQKTQSEEATLPGQTTYTFLKDQLENQKVDNLNLEWGPTPGSKVIRRTWSSYKNDYAYQRIILFSGHTGRHGKKYGTTQDMENYMIDVCQEEVNPDAVLDVKNTNHLKYIPENEVNEIVVDDSRFLPNNIIPEFHRMLKKGGKLAFEPGAGMGWPSLSTRTLQDDVIDIDESGRTAYANQTTHQKIQNNKQEFITTAVNKAQTFFGEMGFSKVEFDQNYRMFVLTK